MNIWPAKYLGLSLVVLAILFNEEMECEKSGSLSEDTNQNFWVDHILPITVPRYEIFAVVSWRQATSSDRYCLGTLLNDRYVLFHFNCFFNERYRLQELFELKFYYGRVMNNSAKPTYEILGNVNIWSYGSVTLIRRISGTFKYSQQLRCIKLPNTEKLILWRKSYNIPNHVEVISSRWCYQNSWYRHLFLKGTRNCTNSIRYKTSKSLIPSCLLHKNIYNDCQFLEGNTLVYNNTLIGIKNYEGETPPPPNDKIKYDLFLNLIPYVPIIQAHMQSYTECPY